MAKYDQFFVNVMMVEELGLQVPDPDDDIIKEGVIMFLAFAGFGAMPLIGCVNPYARCFVGRAIDQPRPPPAPTDTPPRPTIGSMDVRGTGMPSPRLSSRT